METNKKVKRFYLQGLSNWVQPIPKQNKTLTYFNKKKLCFTCVDVSICLYLYQQKQIDMELTKNEKNILKQQIEGLQEFGCCKSWYLEKEDVVVRVSDHLPDYTNFELYNENCKKVVLLCVGVTEKEILSSIEKNEDKFEEIIGLKIDGECVTSENFFTFPDFKFL